MFIPSKQKGRNMKKTILIFCAAFIALLLLLSACSSSGSSTASPEQVAPTFADSIPTPIPTATFTPTLTPTPAPTDHPGWLPEGAVTRFGKGIFHSMAASQDGSMVAIAAAGGVYISDPYTGRIINFLESGADAVDVKFSADGNRIFIGLSVIGAQVWDRTSENMWEKNDAFFQSCANRILVSPDGALLATHCNNQGLVIWDVNSQVLLYQQKIKIPRVYPNPFAMDFSPNETAAIAIAANSSISFLEARSGGMKGIYYTPKNELIIDVEFSPDGSKVALVTDSSSIKLVDAKTYSEINTISHQSKVYTLSFLDNETILSINDGEYVLQKTDGRIVKRIKMGINPNHAVLSKSNILAAATGNEVVFLSLGNEKTIGRITGFTYANWKSVDFSVDGNTFIGTWHDTEYFLSYAMDPDDFIYYTASDICDGGKWISFFGNTDAYLLADCGNDIRVVDIKTLKTIFQAKTPIWRANNTDIYRHPWVDEAELLALLRENQSETGAKYSVEIWEPINNKKLSAFDVDIKDANSWIMFSPQSSVLAVIPREKGNIQIHETSSGKLIQSVPKNSTGEESYLIDDVNSLLFVNKKNALEIISIMSGQTLKKITGLPSGKSVNGINLNKPFQGMQYFNGSGAFIWYYTKDSKNGQTVYFDYYDIGTGEKISDYSIEVPFSRTNPFFEDGRTYRGGVTDLYFHPENNGETAVITVTASDLLNWNHNYIFVVDIVNNKILKTYSFIGNSWFEPDQTPIINNFIFQRSYDTIFKWDVSIEE